ncbi:MAG: DinB family protein [Pseudonocardiales bacterium]|nr:DinB family protein [Pseudonocardiales bacterium]
MDDGSGSTNGLRHGITQAAHLGDERTSLMGFLQRQRDLVAWKLRDTDDAVLRSVSTPTGLTLHGLVRHLENVERSWVRDDFAAEDDVVFDWSDEDPDGDLHVPAKVSMVELLANYAAESARCDAVVMSWPLEQISMRRNSVSLRWILLHLIEETARHLGHIDVLREQADGRVGDHPRPAS